MRTQMMNQNKNLPQTANSIVSPRILTIGVYGYSEETFFQALREAGVDTFCDIRRRRGVRGARYAFANSKRLQARLAELGIQYHHFLELAPTAEIRERQKTADKTARVAKRERTGLYDAIIEAYTEYILASFDADAFLQKLGECRQRRAIFVMETQDCRIGPRFTQPQATKCVLTRLPASS